MKFIKNLIILSGLVLMFGSCETDVVDPAGPRNQAAVPGIKNLNPATYDVNDLSNTYIQFDLTLNASGVDEAVLVVSYKGGKQRKEVARVNSFPSNIRVALTQAASALGLDIADVKAADVFNFEVQTVQGGKTYYSSAAFNVAVVCGYLTDNVTGSYHIYSSPDDWDFEGDVTITADPDDQYILYINGLAAAEGLEDAGPIKLVINPLNYAVTAERSTISASLAPWGLSYTGYSYQGSGQVNTCDGTFDMLFTISVDQGNFGNFPFVLTKN